MNSRFAAVLVTAMVLASGGVGAADCLVQFEAFEGPGANSAQVIARSTVILRLRGDTAGALLPRAQAIAERFNSAAMAGARPADVTVRTVNQQAQLLVSGQAMVTVDLPLARSSNSSPEGLAQSWAANVRAVLAAPYLTLAPYPELLAPVGESRTINWGGTVGSPDTVQIADATIATVEHVTDEKTIIITALKPGDTDLTVGVRECRAIISVVCRKWAARIPPTSQLQVSGRGLRPENLAHAVEILVHGVASLEPGAYLNIGTPTRGGDGYSVNVKADGPTYLPVVRNHIIRMQRIDAPPMSPDALLVSNVPEKVDKAAVLLREDIADRQGARLLWHHVNVSHRPLRLIVRLHNLGDTVVPVHLTEGRAGPSTDEVFAGHVAAARFMSDLFSGTGFVLALPARSSTEISAVRLRPYELASGLKRLVPMGDGELVVEVLSEEAQPHSRIVSAAPQVLYGSRIPSGFVYEGERAAEIEHTVGERWGFYNIGRGTDMSTAGRPLMGSYGVLHQITAKVDNPTDSPAMAELAMHPRGGVARGVFWIDGQLLETPMLNTQTEMVIYRASVRPRSTHSVRLFTIPQSGSNYPVLLALRSRVE